MFVKLSCGYINLDHIAVVQWHDDGSGTAYEVGDDGAEFDMTFDDMAIFRTAIEPPAPTPAPAAAPQVDADRLSEVLKAVADSFYQAYLKDQLFDFDAEDDEEGSDLWPHWKGVRDMVRDVSGVDLLETSREMAFEQLARWRTDSYPRPIQPLTPKKFELPFGITVCRAPGGPPPGLPYVATISSTLANNMGNITNPDIFADTIEHMLQGHAAAGVDIGAPNYVAGLEWAVNQIGIRYDEGEM